MKTNAAEKISEIRCPACDSDAVYKYGKAWTGRQRYLCLICAKQFTFGEKIELLNKPHCPVCGKPMHIYMKAGETSRFRCSAYPKCRTFSKFKLEEVK
jgi:ssDNA-binding Zn-finger/Zn-ribbon topoisomerase 1